MKRLPKDSKFGAPITNLKGTDYVLFSNGTIAEYIEKDRNENIRLQQNYDFFYTDVSQLIDFKTYNPEVKDSKITKLISPIITLCVTMSVFSILIVSYFYSYDLILKITNFTSIFGSFSGLIELIIAFLVMFALGAEFVIFDFLKKDKFEVDRIEIFLVNRDEEPQILLASNENNLLFIYRMHNILFRLTILSGFFNMPEDIDFFYDVKSFLSAVVLINLAPYFLLLLFSPFFLLSYYKKRGFVKIKNSNFSDFVKVAEKQINENKKLSLQKTSLEGKSIEQLLSLSESQGLEFKSSIWTDIDEKTWLPTPTKLPKDSFASINEYNEAQKKHTNFLKAQKDRLQDGVIKSIAGMLNKNGGVLLIGVKDNPYDHEIPTVGIKLDFKHLSSKHQNEDGYRNRIKDIIDEAFGKKTIRQIYLKISIEVYEEHQICRINIKPVERYLGSQIFTKTKTMGDEVFFVRGLAGTDKLGPKDTLSYCQKHFNKIREK